MSAREIKLIKREKSVASASGYDKMPTVADALALLADAQRQLITVQKRITRAREILKNQ